MPSLLVLLVCLCKSFKELFFVASALLIELSFWAKADAMVRLFFELANISVNFFHEKLVFNYFLEVQRVLFEDFLGIRLLFGRISSSSVWTW